MSTATATATATAATHVTDSARAAHAARFVYVAPGTRPPAPETITLWHPASPGVRVTIKPGLLRRLGLRRSPYATLTETFGTQSRTAT